MNDVSLTHLRTLPVAHTDVGDYLLYNGKPTREFVLLARILRARAGLFFVDIQGEIFTTHKSRGFVVGERVNAILTLNVRRGRVDFILRTIEKIN